MSQNKLLKAIILGSERGQQRLDSAMSYPIALQEDSWGKRTLDWAISSLNNVGVNEIVFVGGYHIEKVIKEYPRLKYYYNSGWAKTGELFNLLQAREELDGDCIITSSNIVYHPELLQNLIRHKADIVLCTDVLPGDLSYEQSIFRGFARVKTKGKNVVDIGNSVHEKETRFFIGTLFMSRNSVELLKKKYQIDSENVGQLNLSSVIKQFIDAGLEVCFCESPTGSWSKVTGANDVSKFVIGTKAETLERLRRMMKTATILEQFRFNVEDWLSNKDDVVDGILKQFPKGKVVIRSSALAEDSWKNSMAGCFHSETGVELSREKLIRSIERVIQSFIASKETNELNQIFVQPYLENLKLSGVLFTRDIQSGAPYVVINYDRNEDSADSITSGKARQLNKAIFYKNFENLGSGPDVKRLLPVVQELEKLIGYDFLDVEFAVDKNDDCFVLQVRPTVVCSPINKAVNDDDISGELQNISKFVEYLLKRKPNLSGKTTVLGNMPDWNPAEMIGVTPRPLSSSLYQYLITDYAWAKARALVGYKDVYPEPLLVSLSGHPYIDARVSFNSFLPQGLDHNLADKIVNHYVRRLKKHPHLHDKIEFDIAITCMTFDFYFHADRLSQDGFNNSEIDIFKKALLELTDPIVSGRKLPISELLNQIKQLSTRRKLMLGSSLDQPEDIINAVYHLLDDCKKFGTLPFSILARYAFIGTSFLRSFRQKGIFRGDEYARLLKSIPTIASEISRDIDLLRRGKISKDILCKKFGHLRPGSYDIMSARYDEAFDKYFGALGSKDNLNKSVDGELSDAIFYDIFDKKRNEIVNLLSEGGFSASFSELKSFILGSIKAREFAKFEFSKNLSDALRLLAILAPKLGLTKEDISYLPITKLLAYKAHSFSCAFKNKLAREVSFNRKRHRITQALHLPHIITSVDDVYCFDIHSCQPNFISNKKVLSEVIFLQRVEERMDLSGKIVIIENADPGFDWIFGHRIKGLITKYGGAASHMAIRAAEFGLAAAIGCGALIFEQLRGARVVDLDCLTRQINVVE